MLNSFWDTRTDIPLIDRIRILSEILIPLVKELRVELGGQKTNDILNRTFVPLFKEVGQRYFENSDYNTLEAMQAWGADCGAGDTVTEEIIQNGEALEINITRCEFARLFKDLGNPELGFLLVCSSDYGVFGSSKGLK